MEALEFSAIPSHSPRFQHLRSPHTDVSLNVLPCLLNCTFLLRKLPPHCRGGARRLLLAIVDSLISISVLCACVCAYLSGSEPFIGSSHEALTNTLPFRTTLPRLPSLLATFTASDRLSFQLCPSRNSGTNFSRRHLIYALNASESLKFHILN